MKTYIIAFTLKQRGDKTAWIETILQSGIREGESLTNLQIVDISEYLAENAVNSQNLSEDKGE